MCTCPNYQPRAPTKKPKQTKSSSSLHPNTERRVLSYLSRRRLHGSTWTWRKRKSKIMKSKERKGKEMQSTRRGKRGKGGKTEIRSALVQPWKNKSAPLSSQTQWEQRRTVWRKKCCRLSTKYETQERHTQETLSVLSGAGVSRLATPPPSGH